MACIAHVLALGEKHCRVCEQEVPRSPQPLSAKPNAGSALDEYRAALRQLEQTERYDDEEQRRHMAERSATREALTKASERMRAAMSDLNASLREP